MRLYFAAICTQHRIYTSMTGVTRITGHNLRIIRNEIRANTFSFRVPAEQFTGRAHGWTRLDVARQLIRELGLEVTGDVSLQVIPAGKLYVIQLVDARR